MEEPAFELENLATVPQNCASHPGNLSSTGARGQKRKRRDLDSSKTKTAASEITLPVAKNKHVKTMSGTWEISRQKFPEVEFSEQNVSKQKRPKKRKINNNNIDKSSPKRRRKNLSNQTAENSANKNTDNIKILFKRKQNRQNSTERLAKIFSETQHPIAKISFAETLNRAAMKLLRPVLRGKACPFCGFKTTMERNFKEHLANLHNAVPATAKLATLDVSFYESQATSSITDYVGVDPTDIEQYEMVRKIFCHYALDIEEEYEMVRKLLSRYAVDNKQ